MGLAAIGHCDGGSHLRQGGAEHSRVGHRALCLRTREDADPKGINSRRRPKSPGVFTPHLELIPFKMVDLNQTRNGVNLLELHFHR